MMAQDKRERGDYDYDDDEDMNGHHTSATVGREKNNSEIPDIPFCGFLSVRFYQPYFDIDTADVVSRISSSIFYCRREENFLVSMKDKPDAYGPFWIATTLIFIVAVTSHVNSWLSSWMTGKNWYAYAIPPYASD